MQHETARCTCHPKSACGSYTRMQSWSFSAHVRDLDVTALAADVGPQQGAGARAGCAFARSSCFDRLHVQRTRSQCLSTCTCLVCTRHSVQAPHCSRHARTHLSKKMRKRMLCSRLASGSHVFSVCKYPCQWTKYSGICASTTRTYVHRYVHQLNSKNDNS